jgi:hypothetical protein
MEEVQIEEAVKVSGAAAACSREPFASELFVEFAEA